MMNRYTRDVCTGAVGCLVRVADIALLKRRQRHKGTNEKQWERHYSRSLLRCRPAHGAGLTGGSVANLLMLPHRFEGTCRDSRWTPAWELFPTGDVHTELAEAFSFVGCRFPDTSAENDRRE